MALDTSIALNIKPIEQPNMLAQMGQMMQMRQMQQGYEQQNALRDAFAQGADITDPATFKRIAQQDPTLAYKLKGQHLEQQQKGVETGIKINEALGGGLEWLSKNPSLDNAKNLFSDFVSKGILPSEKAQAMFAKLQAEPDKIGYYANLGYQTAIGAEKKLANATTIRGQDLSHAASMAHVGATIRGQNQAEKHWQYDIDNPKMTPLAGEKVVNGEKIPAYFGYDPRSNTMVEVAMPTVTVGAPTTLPTNALAPNAPANVNALTMPPAGAPTSPVARPATAAMPSAVAPSAAMPSAAAPTSVVPGGANAPAPVRFGPKSTSENLTEAQGKATGFALRAAEAHKIINDIGKSGEVQPGIVKRVAESIPLVGEGLGTALNATQTSSQQQVEQAQRAFVNAILRQESGAAINESEFNNAKKQYFPQPGDKPAVIEQKRQNRETAIKSLEIAGGPGMKQANKPTSGVIDFGSLK